MSAKNLVCLVVDGLHAGMVGAYGNSWIHTEQLDRFAGQSFVFDQAFVECPTLDAIYGALWYARSASPPRQAVERSFASVATAAGWQTTLVTDEPQVMQLPGAADFGQLEYVDQPPPTAQMAEPHETNTSRLFEAVSSRLTKAREPFVLWIHAQGLLGPWDAPHEFRERYADPDDPAPPTLVEPPIHRLPDDYDADELLGIAHAYAGQLALFDLYLGALLEQIDTAGLSSSTQVTLLSARGYPLGEHLRVGACDDALYNELTQLVWMMRFPEEFGMLDRTASLVVPADLSGTLLDWLGIASGPATAARSLMPMIRGDQTPLRDRVQMASSSDRALRTAAWLLRRPATGQSRLYAKPSDRWEVSDVAKLCPDITSGMEAALGQAATSGDNENLLPLAPALTTEVD